MTDTKTIVRAIVKREVTTWFSNPMGYVFIAVFVFVSALILFREEFFQANVATLDTLNEWFPQLLCIFVPLLTMGLWAGERAQGTDELILTLPATDFQVVLGKFLAGGAIYTCALLFTIPQVIVLSFLGTPDWPLMLGNYLGFWLLGNAPGHRNGCTASPCHLEKKADRLRFLLELGTHPLVVPFVSDLSTTSADVPTEDA